MTRALVLGGGGPVGVAWEVGLIAGLQEAGVDLTAADRIVGTSAGSIVGAHVARDESIDELVEVALARSARGPSRPVDLAKVAPVGAAMFEAMTTARPPGEVVRELGALALDLAGDLPPESDIVAAISPDLGEAWPARDYVCTAWEITSGTFTVWDAAAGVPLALAVASSCTVPGIWPALTIGGGRYIDGGVLSASNAQLAAGHDQVVVVSVVTRIVSEMLERLRGPLDQEVAGLEADGAGVEVIEFDDRSIEVCGGNPMDFSIAQPMLEAGMAQGRQEAERIGALWG